MLTFLLGDSNKSLHSQQNYALQKFLKENLTQGQKSTVTVFVLKNVVLKEDKFYCWFKLEIDFSLIIIINHYFLK